MVEVPATPGAGRLVEHTLRTIPGVDGVTVDPRTGAVVVSYRPAERRSPAPEATPALVPALRAPARSSSALTAIVGTVVTVAVEMALQRVLGPLFFRRS
jgi:hypothetical protein